MAAYETYIEAQHAVDHLSDKAFPVQHVTIVGTDLRMVERVTGRLTYSRVALAGLATGAWFGLFVGLLLSLFATADAAALPILPAVAIGAAFGILFSVISYAFAGGKRDFTSSSQIVASTYALLCASEHAHKARALLAEPGGPGIGRPAFSAQTSGPGLPGQPGTPARPDVPAQPGDPTEPGYRNDPNGPGYRNDPPAPPAGPGA